MLELHFFGRLGDLSGEIDTSIDYSKEDIFIKIDIDFKIHLDLI